MLFNHVKTTTKKMFVNYKRVGYNKNVLKQSACLMVNPIRVGNFGFLFNCKLVRLIYLYLYMRGLGPDDVSMARPTRIKQLDFFCSGI